MTATDAVAEVAEVAEEVAEQALNVASTSRGLDSRGFAFAFGAFLIGTGIGGSLTYVLAKRRLETKYGQIADDEIAEMREHYNAKGRALEAEYAKKPVEDLVKERGYSSPDSDTTKPPMAVPPPAGVVEDSDDREAAEREVHERLRAPEERNVFDEHGDFEWDWHKERRGRAPDVPYVIHYDEREEMDGYDIHTLTYYEGDDVMCNERDEIIDPDDRNALVGEKNLERFGHGSNDPSVVYVRNDKLELVYEVVRSPNSYSEEVHGIKHESSGRGNLERMRARERDDPEA